MKKRPKKSNTSSPESEHRQQETSMKASVESEMRAKADFELLRQALLPLPPPALPAMLLAHAAASRDHRFEDIARQLLVKKGLGDVDHKDIQFVHGKLQEYAGAFLMQLPELEPPPAIIEPAVSQCQTCD